MKHVSEGNLRALHDGALTAEERARVENHLSACRRCAERASAIQGRGEYVQALLSELDPDSHPEAIKHLVAETEIRSYRRRKERPMARRPVSGHYRHVWAGVALAVVTILIVTVAPLRSMAADLLAVFRVQKITFTPVDSEGLPDEKALEALAPEIERMFGDTLAVASESQPEVVSEAAARKRAVFDIRLPAAAEPTRHEWAGPMQLSVDIDLPQLRALFAELGYEVDLPQELDGRTVEAGFSGMLTSYYGNCQQEGVDRPCTTLVQMASPRVSIPDGLSVEELGRIYLELLGTPASEAARLSEQIDWTTTLVVPFPHHVNMTHQSLPLDGVEATLIHSESSYRPTPEYLLTWVKGDVIYAIAGRGDYIAAVELVDSLE